MTAYSEETIEIQFGQGLYSADLPSAIPDEFCSQAFNVVPTGTSLENRFGFTKTTIDHHVHMAQDADETWKKQAIAPPMSHLGNSGNEDGVTLAWGSPVEVDAYETHLLREGTPFEPAPGQEAVQTKGQLPGGPVGTAAIDDGYITIATGDYSTQQFMGAVNYLDWLYIFLDQSVKKVTAIDWTAGTLTEEVLVGFPTNVTCPPVHFFDRLWVADGSKLRYTDVPSVPGGAPDTWNLGANFRVINGEAGPGKIYKLIPFNTKLLIFTSVGLFTLSVIGSPANWYLRALDESATSNSYQAGFEHNGLVYYITIRGVFVTDGSSTVMLSGAIQNFFLAGNFDASADNQTKRYNIYRINYLDGGMVISISNFYFVEDVLTANVEDSYQFYSRLDNVAWSQWNFSTNSQDDENELFAILSVADSAESFVNKTPLSFILAQHSKSGPNVNGVIPGEIFNVTQELFVYDGLKDVWTPQVIVPPDISEKSIEAIIRSAYVGAGRLLDLKHGKYAFIELFFNSADHYSDETIWRYGWNTDFKAINPGSDVIQGQPTPDNLALEFAAVKLECDVQFRIIQFEIVIDTNNVATFKMKSVHLKTHETRDVPQFVG